MNLEDYFEINGTYELKDGVCNVKGSVNLIKRVEKLPVKFGIVTGDFNCSYNNLTDLKNSPKVIDYDFYCESNKIKTLENFKSQFEGHFYCDPNPISVFGLHGRQSDLILDFAIINPIRKGKVIKYLLDLFYEDKENPDNLINQFSRNSLVRPDNEKIKSNGYEIS